LTTPCPESKITAIRIKVGWSLAVGYGMVPGRRVAFDVSHAVATTSTVAILMLPTEPIGSIPRPAALLEGVQSFRAGRISQPELSALYDAAVRDTIRRLEATGSPVITDGEQAKHSFATYSDTRPRLMFTWK
jgi:hypothetical protein